MNGEFYIGYQKKMPPEMAAFLKRRITLLLLLVAVISSVLVTVQQPFARATFEFGEVKTFGGIVNEFPYPTLTLHQPVGDRQDVARSRYFLVAPGKHGAQSLMSGYDGKKVQLQGTLLYRDDKTMIEIKPGTIRHRESGEETSGTAESLGVFTLRGEIVDSKCYLGVMKPGNVKPHKSCAIRCISGGITPVLCVRDESGNALYVMLAGKSGKPINDDVIPFVAEPVEMTGAIERRDDLLIMKIDPGMIRRL